MAARKTRKKAAASTSSISVPTFRVLKGFHHPPVEDGTFSFSRFYWLDGTGHRQSILSNFRKKRRPVQGDGDQDTAAKVEVLLPGDAPQEYWDSDFLVRRYEEILPTEENTAYAQVTLRFPDARSVHHPYEVARSWVRSFFVDDPDIGVPVVLAVHAPYLAGSQSPIHCHALVLPYQLRWHGWGKAVADLANDQGQARALVSWTQFRKERL